MGCLDFHVEDMVFRLKELIASSDVSSSSERRSNPREVSSSSAMGVGPRLTTVNDCIGFTDDGEEVEDDLGGESNTTEAIDVGVRGILNFRLRGLCFETIDGELAPAMARLLFRCSFVREVSFAILFGTSAIILGMRARPSSCVDNVDRI